MTQDQPNTHPDPLAALLEEAEAQRKQLIANTLANKTAIFDALAAANITRIDVNFDGCGDSGQIEAMTAMTGEIVCELPPTQVPVFGQPRPQTGVTPSTVPLSEAIETLIYDLLKSAHDGWEINEGAYGDFIFNVAERTIRLEYNERIESTQYSEHQF